MVVKLIQQLVLWLLTYSLLLAIFLIPTDVEFFHGGVVGQYVGANSGYTVEKHVDQVKSFFAYIKENDGLGNTPYGSSIFGDIAEKFRRSLKIIVPAMLISFIIGIAKGIFDYRTRNSFARLPGQGTTWLGLSVPDLFFVVLAQVALSAFIANGWIFKIDLYGHEKIDNIILCILFLTIYPTAYVANVTFQVFRDEEGEDYIRTAKSKGIGDFPIYFKHMLKNGIRKILSHSNTVVLYVLSNLFIIEMIMEYRGAAFYFRQSLGNPSKFMVGMDVIGTDVIYAAGYAFIFTFIVLIANIITELAKHAVTPFKGGVDS